jgi:hypothetical protein
MIHYRTQPMGYVDGEFKSILNNHERKKEIVKKVGEYIKLPHEEVVDLITDASIMDAMILAGDYKNILIVTTTNLTNENGDHLIPVIHKFNYGVGNISVTQPKLYENRLGGLYQDFDIDVVEVDTFFHLGQDKLRMKHNGEPFDAVVLLGNESISNVKHKLHDIKSMFSPHCTEVFDLIDIHRGSKRKLHGGIFPKEKADMISSIILNEDMSIKKETDKYKRVFNNIEFLEEIYKVG